MLPLSLPYPWKLAIPARDRDSLTELERLTAGWIALAFLLIGTRLWVLELAAKAQPGGAVLAPWLPLAAYQDLALVLGLAFGAEGLLRLVPRPRLRFLIRFCCWITCLVAAWYSVASVEIFRFLSTPLTYRLIAMSHNLRGIRSSMDAALTHERIAFVASAPVIVLAITFGLIRFGRGIVRRVRSLSRRLPARIAIAGYFVVASAATHVAQLEAAVLANPHLALLTSLWDRDDPFVRGAFDMADLSDFRGAVGEQIPSSESDWSGRAKGANVVMLVMESVGARPLGHYGATYDTTPELSRLARQGVTFQRVYASQPYTSNAMAGIFCSIYPWHGWRSLPRRDPDLNITGMGNVLQSAGYRTGMLHTGDMQFDNEKRFLKQHGFDEVHDVWSLQSVLGGEFPGADTPDATPGMHLHLPDGLLLPAATRWIDADRTRPFFLALWTIQTHHPYFAEPSQIPFEPGDLEQNRYLNAIRVSDQLLGDLVNELGKRGLLDSTIIVVLGDHGEAFGQHAHHGHSKTIYDEELHIPLVIASPQLPQQNQRLDMLGQQIDIAPTILELLGLAAPAGWQGRSLFANDRTNRAYFFTAFYQYLFGVIEGDRKYIWNASTGRAQFFDLNEDPGERLNLFGSAAAGSMPDALHRRLASWVHFQNPYLEQFLSSH